MTPIVTDGRLSLLWRTIFLLTLCVIIIQICLYLWIQRSVNEHFEQMDSEVLTHEAFNIRQHIADSTFDNQDTVLASEQLRKPPSRQNAGLDYDVKTVITDNQGQVLASNFTGFMNGLQSKRSLAALWQQYHEQPFDLIIEQRHYRAIVIRHAERLALIALPIDVHHQYLAHFNRQLIMILVAITFILVFVAAFSVHLGFAPLSTIRQKMTRIDTDQLDDRIVVSDMPSELRPLADAYNAMMEKLEHNFATLSRFSEDIAHELRTPLATLGTQTQVMLSKPRNSNEYIEQLHDQHETIEQLSNLIDNMLLLAKTQKGSYDSQFAAVNIETIISNILSYYEFIAEDKGICFEQRGAFKPVLGDNSLLQRLFTNLISNAVYYAKSESLIIINASSIINNNMKMAQKNRSTASESHYLKIIVTNQLNSPMTQREADKLSGRFYRHHKDNALHSGTGLGLSIVQAIVSAHKGKMSITVQDEYYFKVSVSLPIY